MPRRKKTKPEPLSNFDIMHMMNKCPKFVGVYSRDDTPKLKKGESMVVNLDDSEGPGTHWCCMYREKDKVEYFDSYGFPPPQEIVDQYNGMRYSSNEIQMINAEMIKKHNPIRSIKGSEGQRNLKPADNGIAKITAVRKNTGYIIKPRLPRVFTKRSSTTSPNEYKAIRLKIRCR